MRCVTEAAKVRANSGSSLMRGSYPVASTSSIPASRYPSWCRYVCALFKKNNSAGTRKAKKVHHLLALQSARAATCLVYPFPGLSFQGYERESGTRYRRFMPPVAEASAPQNTIRLHTAR